MEPDLNVCGYSEKLCGHSLKVLAKALVDIELIKGESKDWIGRPLGQKGRRRKHTPPIYLILPN